MLPLILIFIMINLINKWGNLTSPVYFSFAFIIFICNSGKAQNNLDCYSRFSFSIGFENSYGFQMDELPFGIQYTHEKQLIPSLGISYDFFRSEKSTVRTGIRIIRIIEKEFFILTSEYTTLRDDFIFFIDTSTGFEDLRYEVSLDYNYNLYSSKNTAFYIGSKGFLGYGQNTHPSILEFNVEDNNGFESHFISSHRSPNNFYGKIGVETGIKLSTSWLLARVNFYYHHRLRNLYEGKLIINNSNNERIEQDYVLKGHSFGVGLSLYPKKANKGL